MFVSRVLARVSRTIPRSSLLLSSPQTHHFPSFSNQFHSIINESPNKLVPSQVSLFNLSSSHLQRFGFASSASPEAEKENGTNAENNDSDEDNLTMDDLVKLVAEKEELLKLKHKEIEKMQDKVLRSYAEMENVMDRTRREAENSKKFAIQSFAKSLLDVADNLERASSVVKESFAKIDKSKDSSEATPLLKSLLEGVEMTEKQLSKVFKKYGMEKYDPTNEPFDPHRHNAAFELPDASKPPGTVAIVLKPGYVLYDRVIRPAEVGVTREVANDAADKE
ncbi:grpE protein homolog 2, mitochondrial isoform X3 [Morus notabilis]|uniref:grpE protein homolog 2, mitochondrial isoform X3 n=1 Tax=Morus notabilis TaxID=981085 RepID=UPI000CED74CE|nr:grpE protein homolog 2, mitochondrial isoform X3 [Morus notabilis]